MLLIFHVESVFKYGDEESRRPRVPHHKDRPQMATKTTRNFITTNAVTNIMSVPRKPASKYVDAPKGTQHLVEVCKNVSQCIIINNCY